jgi:hypothetical protein
MKTITFEVSHSLMESLQEFAGNKDITVGQAATMAVLAALKNEQKKGE